MHLPKWMTLVGAARWLPAVIARRKASTTSPTAVPAGAAGKSSADVAERRPLFRHQVLANQQAQSLGTVLLTPRLSHQVFAAFAALTVAGLLALLYYGDFTRKARVNGWLVPETGLVRVFAPRPGVVVALHVVEGQHVRKGAPLLALSDELRSTTLGAVRAEIARRLIERRDSLLQEQRENQQLFAQQQQVLAERVQMVRAEERQIAREIDLQQSRVTFAERAEVRQREIRRLGYISDQQLQQAEEAKLEQIARLVALERDRINAQRERLVAEGELQQLPIKARAQDAINQRSIAAVEQELAESEALREIIIPAPQDGTVTAIQAEAGGRAAANVPLLSIVPPGATLEAHLYSPSRAVGFIRPDQRVLLRYQAYPYQKFGQYQGVVVSISRSALSPSELPSQLSSLATLSGTNEPVYRIVVRLASQAVTAYGKQLPLQPGMQLEADVALERRRLYEWVLDPLYTVTGKWQQ